MKQFNDEVADLTGWSSIRPHSYFSTSNDRKLIHSNNTLKYKTTIEIKFFFGLFIVIGFIVLAITCRNLLNAGNLSFIHWLGPAIGLLFIGVAIFFLNFISLKAEFDGHKQILKLGKIKKIKFILFREIYAFQLISVQVASEDGNYINYQLNLVYLDGEREFLAQYSDADIAYDDADKISDFVKKPLWSTVDQREIAKKSNRKNFILVFFLVISATWAFPFSPVVFINIQQYLNKSSYQLVQFESQGYDAHSKQVQAIIDGNPEKLAVGHFYRHHRWLPDVLSGVLPGDAAKIFKAGEVVTGYYNKNLSNLTFNSKTTRFMSVERYHNLTVKKTLWMVIVIWGPFFLSLLAFLNQNKINKIFSSRILSL